MAHRTALITAGSIAAVVFAGAIVVGVNLGILSFADSAPVGKLSASTGLQTSGSKVAQAYAGTKTSADAQNSQKYVIKKAGTVRVAFSKTGVRLVDVSAKRHWKWALAQTLDKRLTVTFRSGATIYKFVATLDRHGSIVARVDQPITKTVTTPSSAGSAATPVVAVASTASTVRPASTGDGEPESHAGSEADD